MNAKLTYLLTLFLLLSGSAFAQTSHHVYSTDIPWKNANVSQEDGKLYRIQDAIEQAQAGDEIVLHEGVYRETIAVTKNNLRITNYQNDYVLVTGAELVDNWTKAEGMAEGIMVADISGLAIETDYTQLFANGKNQMMARHPNNTSGDMMDPMKLSGGYAPLSQVYKDAGVIGAGHITLENTTVPDVDLTGGIVRTLTGKMRQYVLGEITANSGNSVAFTALNNGEWKDEAAFGTDKHKFSWGFLMHKNLIDAPGEWFAENDKLYYLPEAGVKMDDMRIEIQVRQRVLVLNNTSGVSLSGINFIAGNADMQNTTGATLEACSMRYLHPFWIPKSYGQNDSDPKGIYLSGSSNNTFTNNYLAHTWGNMIALRDGENNSFENCVITDFGWIGIFTSGIHINKSDNTNINKCTFGDACRFQIRIDGGDAKVNILDCDFYGSMKLGEDAGPIEATSTGRIGTIDLKGSVIAYNRVHDVVGVPVSNGNYKRVKATAFYMEDVENYTAHHNLVYNIKHTVDHGEIEVERVGEFLYLGPRYNAMHKPVNYYNNTIWNVDENIGIWNIVIDNWKELGIAPPDTTGLIENGHFANNIFMNGPGFKMSYNAQVLNSTGGKVAWAPNPAGASISTLDFDEYTTHCATWGYHFNPENNMFFDFADQSAIFADAANGDFNLHAHAAAKNAGVALDGITSSATPDCGALEGSDRVLQAGATRGAPNFEEEGASFVPDTERVEFIDFPSELADTTTQFVFKVRYTAFEPRDLIVAINTPKPEETFVNNSKVSVQAGTDTATVSIKVDALLPQAQAYKIFTALRPVGGNWQTNIASQTLYTNLVAEITPEPETIALKNLPATIESTETTLSFDVDVAVNEARNLVVSLLTASNDTAATKTVALNKGEQSTSLVLQLAKALVAESTYTLLLELKPTDANEVLASASGSIAVLAGQPLLSPTARVPQLSLFPNPAQEQLTVELAQNTTRPIRLAIYSTTGALVHTQQVPTNTRRLSLNIAKLPQGTYIVSIREHERAIFHKH